MWFLRITHGQLSWTGSVTLVRGLSVVCKTLIQPRTTIWLMLFSRFLLFIFNWLLMHNCKTNGILKCCFLIIIYFSLFSFLSGLFPYSPVLPEILFNPSLLQICTHPLSTLQSPEWWIYRCGLTCSAFIYISLMDF